MNLLLLQHVFRRQQQPPSIETVLAAHELSCSAHAGCLVGGVSLAPGAAPTPVFASGQGPHVVLGRCRSGKTAGVTIPSLRSWPGSAVVLDVVGELHQQTAEHRESVMRQRIVRFAPFDENSNTDTYNAIDALRDDTPEVILLARELAFALLPTAEAAPIIDQHLIEPARAMLAAFCLAAGSRAGSLGDVRRAMLAFAADPSFDLYGVGLHGDKQVEIMSALKRHAESSQDWQRNVMMTALSALAAFSNPAVDAATRSSSFTEQDVFGDCATTVYLSARPYQIEPVRGLFSFLLKRFAERSNAEDEIVSAGDLNVLVRQGVAPQHKLLLQLDEAACLGRLAWLRARKRREPVRERQRADDALDFGNFTLQLGVQSCQALASVAGRDMAAALLRGAYLTLTSGDSGELSVLLDRRVDGEWRKRVAEMRFGDALVCAPRKAALATTLPLYYLQPGH